MVLKRQVTQSTSIKLELILGLKTHLFRPNGMHDKLRQRTRSQSRGQIFAPIDAWNESRIMICFCCWIRASLTTACPHDDDALKRIITQLHEVWISIQEMDGVGNQEGGEKEEGMTVSEGWAMHPSDTLFVLDVDDVVLRCRYDEAIEGIDSLFCQSSGVSSSLLDFDHHFHHHNPRNQDPSDYGCPSVWPFVDRGSDFHSIIMNVWRREDFQSLKTLSSVIHVRSPRCTHASEEKAFGPQFWEQNSGLKSRKTDRWDFCCLLFWNESAGLLISLVNMNMDDARLAGERTENPTGEPGVEWETQHIHYLNVWNGSSDSRSKTGGRKMEQSLEWENYAAIVLVVVIVVVIGQCFLFRSLVSSGKSNAFPHPHTHDAIPRDWGSPAARACEALVSKVGLMRQSHVSHKQTQRLNRDEERN